MGFRRGFIWDLFMGFVEDYLGIYLRDSREDSFSEGFIRGFVGDLFRDLFGGFMMYRI